MTRIAITVILLLLTASAVLAQGSNCGPRDRVTAALAARFGEAPAGMGLRSGGGQVMEIWASPETGTWTILMTVAGGVTCLMASGSDWHQETPVHIEGEDG